MSDVSAPHLLASFYDDFFIGGGHEDARYIDGLIVKTNRGSIARLYARGYSNKDGVNSRQLSQFIKSWNIEPDNPFSYTVKPLPESVKSKLAGSKHKNADQLVTIVGMDITALTQEVKYAKKVLSAWGLRVVGPSDPDDDIQYRISKQALMSINRKKSNENISSASVGVSHTPMSAQLTTKHTSAVETDDQTSYLIESDDLLPVGAAREWLFLKSIAIAAGVPWQPTSVLAMYRSTIDDKRANNAETEVWSVPEHTGAAKNKTDAVNKPLNDASQIRHFLVDNLTQMESRFTLMSQECGGWGTHQFGYEDQTVQRHKDAEVFNDIKVAIASLKVRAENSMAAGADDDLSALLRSLGAVCKNLGGVQWAEKDFITLAYTAELLTIVEHCALYFQQETVNRINNGHSKLPDGVIAAMQGLPVEIAHGYGQQLEGQLVNPGILPAGYQEEFPCIMVDDKFVMLQGADILPTQKQGIYVLSTPEIPEIPKWMSTTASRHGSAAPVDNFFANVFNGNTPYKGDVPQFPPCKKSTKVDIFEHIDNIINK